MQTTVPDPAEPTLLGWLVSAALAMDEPLSLRLYQNDLTPGRATITLDFVECDFAGYAAVTINRADWGVPVVVDHEASVEPTASPFVFTATAGAQDVFGVFLVGTLSGITYYCRRFNPTRTIDNANPLPVRPVITLSSPLVSS